MEVRTIRGCLSLLWVFLFFQGHSMSWRIEYFPHIAQGAGRCIISLKKDGRIRDPQLGIAVPPWTHHQMLVTFFQISEVSRRVGSPSLQAPWGLWLWHSLLKSLHADVPILRRRLPTGPLMFCSATSFHRLQKPNSEHLDLQFYADQTTSFNNSSEFSIAGELLFWTWS